MGTDYRDEVISVVLCASRITNKTRRIASSGYLAVSTSIRVLNTDQDTAGRGHHQKEAIDPWKTHKTNYGLVLSVCFLTDIIHYF